MSDNPEIKAKIKDELFLIMQDEPYSKITITTLVERLGMSRQNFYRYYTSKDEILLELLDNTLEAMYHAGESLLPINAEDHAFLAEQLCNVIAPQKDMIKDILDSANNDVIFAHIQRFVRQVIGRILREGNHTNIDQDSLEMVIANSTGSGYHMISAWAKSDKQLDNKKFICFAKLYIDVFFESVKLAIDFSD
ncbi:TetR/AcrR family transcriptional regulator [Spongiibacter marinus]|uniref:TetR/AcrR family transcriptional regulator n=1 Tax=Spongiibacter marinus TaxID=354246 RepID=UPI0035BEA3A7